MTIRLTRIRKLGRYEHKTTGQQVNVHKGQRRDGGVGDIHFYTRSGERVLLPEAEFYRDWKRVEETTKEIKAVTNPAKPEDKALNEKIKFLNWTIEPMGVRIAPMGRGWGFVHQGLYRGLSRFLSKPLIETPDLDLIEFAKLAKESIQQQIDEDAGPQYSVAITTVGQNWNDSGMRHRVECSDGRVSGWARYEQVAYLDNVASLTPYFVGGDNVVARSISEALTFIAVGPNDNQDDESEVEEAGE